MTSHSLLLGGASGAWIDAVLWTVFGLNLLLALWVLLARGRGTSAEAKTLPIAKRLPEANAVFALTATSVAAWTLSNLLFRSAQTEEGALLLARLSYGSALLVAASFLHFAWVYPRRGDKSARHKGALYLLAALITALGFVPGLFVHGVEMNLGAGGSQVWGGRRLDTAPGVVLVAAFMLTSSLLAFGALWRSQGQLRGRLRAQARYVLFGSALTALVGLFFNLGLPLGGDYRWVWVGPVGSLFFVGFSVYSILTHRLFDVRLLIRRTLVYSFLLALLAGAFAAVEKALEQGLSPLLGSRSFATDLLAALLIGFAIDPLKRQLHRLVNRKLFRGEAEAE